MMPPARQGASAPAEGMGQVPDCIGQGIGGLARLHAPAPVAPGHAGHIHPGLAAQAQVILHLGHKQLRDAALARPQQRPAHRLGVVPLHAQILAGVGFLLRRGGGIPPGGGVVVVGAGVADAAGVGY